MMLNRRMFEIQQELDDVINESKGLSGHDVMQERQLSLLVEIGEMANEERSFKFWSNNKLAITNINTCKRCKRWKLDKCRICKGEMYKNPLLDEFVDCIHFLLSIGNYSGFTFQCEDDDYYINTEIEGSPTELFLSIYDSVVTFMNMPTPSNYLIIWDCLMSLGRQVGFHKNQIMSAYLEKNLVNHERQVQGY